MASFSVRDLDEETTARLKREAQDRGISINALILQLIRQGVSTWPEESHRRIYHDLDALAGTWTDAEACEFLSTQADFEQIDAKLWK